MGIVSKICLGCGTFQIPNVYHFCTFCGTKNADFSLEEFIKEMERDFESVKAEACTGNHFGMVMLFQALRNEAEKEYKVNPSEENFEAIKILYDSKYCLFCGEKIM